MLPRRSAFTAVKERQLRVAFDGLRRRGRNGGRLVSSWPIVTDESHGGFEAGLSRVQPGAPGMGCGGRGGVNWVAGWLSGGSEKRRFTPHSTTLREGGCLRVCVRDRSEGVLVAFGCAAERGAGASARAIRRRFDLAHRRQRCPYPTTLREVLYQPAKGHAGYAGSFVAFGGGHGVTRPTLQADGRRAKWKHVLFWGWDNDFVW